MERFRVVWLTSDFVAITGPGESVVPGGSASTIRTGQQGTAGYKSCDYSAVAIEDTASLEGSDISALGRLTIPLE
eukprot:scaffold918_cov126-Cylindrotheca_fusiformis.AAC.84